MYCFLTTLEGWFLGLLLLLSFVVIGQKSRIKKLSAKLDGSMPLHPQDRLRAKRMASRKAAAKPQPQPAEPAPQPAPVLSATGPMINPLDWLAEPGMPAPDLYPGEILLDTDGKVVGIGTKPAPPAPQGGDVGRWIDRYAPHIKPFLFALSVVGVWYALAWYYDHLNHYTPPAGDEIGDFRILYLKKFVGALLPMISSVGAALGLLFMLNPRYYIYLNGWLLTDYDFYTDLRHLDKPECFRRVLIFTALFGLFLLVSLWVLLHSSPQELTL